MASIERTAYPRFKRNPSIRELGALYTPTDDEMHFARIIARKHQPRFGLLLLLKAFQRLGYFPSVDDIPATIVQHVRIAAGIDAETPPLYAELRTLYQHHQAIRERLGVSAWGEEGLRVASEAMAAAVEVMDNPADFINVAIEDTEIAGRTEKYWCPIKNARRMMRTHPYYDNFVDFGDAESYHKELANLREELAKFAESKE